MMIQLGINFDYQTIVLYEVYVKERIRRFRSNQAIRFIR